MSPETADALVRWTARGAVVCYLLRVILDLRSRGRFRTLIEMSWSRSVWTIGCLLFVWHFASAFALVHHFDHTHAYEHTAQRTAEVVGIDWGGGIYVNHAFLVFWIFDVARWWIKGLSSAYIPQGYFWSVHAVFAFMFVNATMIFGPAHWIWVGAGVGVLLIAVWYFSKIPTEEDLTT